LLFFEAVDRGSVALAVLTFYAAPLVIALVAPLVLPERPSLVAFGACAVGAVGIGAIALDGNAPGGAASAVAIAAGLGSAVSYAALVILSKRLLTAATPPLTVAFWDCLVGGLVVAPLLVFADRVLPDDAGEWGAVLVLGVVFTGLSTLAYAVTLRHVTAQAAGILTFLEPVAAVLLAGLLLDEPVEPATLAGGALVLLAGLAVVALDRPDATAETATPPVAAG
jgi:drug/metabolite transporter (DMT)-like permease